MDYGFILSILKQLRFYHCIWDCFTARRVTTKSSMSWYNNITLRIVTETSFELSASLLIVENVDMYEVDILTNDKVITAIQNFNSKW